MNSYSFKVYLRPDRTRSDGSKSVIIRVILDRKVKKYSLGKNIHPKYWNEKKSECKPGLTGWDTINNLLKHYETELSRLWLEFSMKGRHLQMSDLDTIFSGNNANSKDFYKFVENTIDLEKNKLRPATISSYNAEVAKLKEFRPVLTFDLVNTLFLKGYEKHLAEIRKNTPITIHKSLRFIKAICTRATNEEVLKESPFKRYAIGKAPTGNMEFLTIDEVLKLEKLYCSPLPEMQKEVLRYFLFSCYTGMRYGDLKTFVQADIQRNDSGLSVYKEMQKTGKITLIPLCDRAKGLIRTFKDEPGNIFRVYCSQYTNRSLKEIMQLVDIQKSISIHCGRHTFATIAAQIGLNAWEIQKILDHHDIRTTQGYMNVTNPALTEKMKLFDKLGA